MAVGALRIEHDDEGPLAQLAPVALRPAHVPRRPVVAAGKARHFIDGGVLLVRVVVEGQHHAGVQLDGLSAEVGEQAALDCELAERLVLREGFDLDDMRELQGHLDRLAGLDLELDWIAIQVSRLAPPDAFRVLAIEDGLRRVLARRQLAGRVGKGVGKFRVAAEGGGLPGLEVPDVDPVHRLRILPERAVSGLGLPDALPLTDQEDHHAPRGGIRPGRLVEGNGKGNILRACGRAHG